MILDLMRDNSRTFPLSNADIDVVALRVWHCSYRSLQPLAQFESLRTLVIATYPDDDLQPLAGLAQLEYLAVIHLPRVSDLSLLAQLPRLRTVRLQTLPSWDASRKVTTVDSLRPLASLPLLEHVELFGVVTEDRSLADLEHAPALTSVRVSQFPREEVARFRAATQLSDRFAPRPGVADWD